MLTAYTDGRLSLDLFGTTIPHRNDSQARTSGAHVKRIFQAGMKGLRTPNVPNCQGIALRHCSAVIFVTPGCPRTPLWKIITRRLPREIRPRQPQCSYGGLSGSRVGSRLLVRESSPWQRREFARVARRRFPAAGPRKPMVTSPRRIARGREGAAHPLRSCPPRRDGVRINA